MYIACVGEHTSPISDKFRILQRPDESVEMVPLLLHCIYE